MLAIVCCGQVIITNKSSDMEVRDDIICPKCATLHRWDSDEVSDLCYSTDVSPAWAVKLLLDEITIPVGSSHQITQLITDLKLPLLIRTVAEDACYSKVNIHVKALYHNLHGINVTTFQKVLEHAKEFYSSLIMRRDQLTRKLEEYKTKVCFPPYMSREPFELPEECKKTNAEWRVERDAAMKAIRDELLEIEKTRNAEMFAGAVIDSLFGLRGRRP
jgi:hypothetical protein